MLSLIKNEFIKLFHRPIFYIILGMVVLLVCGWVFVSVHQHNESLKHNYMSHTAEQELASRKSELAQCEKNVDKLNAKENDLRKEEIKTAIAELEMQVEYKLDFADWRTSVIHSYIDSKNSEDPDQKKQSEKLLSMIKNNDWKAYVNQEIQQTEDSTKKLKVDSFEYKIAQIQIEEFNLMLDNNIVPNSFYEQDVNNYSYNKQVLLERQMKPGKPGQYTSEFSNEELKKANSINLYRIQHHILPSIFNYEAYTIDNTMRMSVILTVLLLILSTLIFCTEFSNKTIKHLIMCPYGRCKIIYSKLIVIIITGILFFALFFGLTLILCAIFCKTGANTLQYVVMPGNTIYEMSFYTYTLISLLLKFVTFLFYLSILLFFVVFTKSTVATLATSIILNLGAVTVISKLYRILGYKWFKYTPFITADFNQYLDTKYLAGGYNFPIFVAITAGTIILLTVLSLIRFKRIEV